jgi:hypothetical protein
MTGNPIKGLRRGVEGHRRRRGATASVLAHGESGEREFNWPGSFLPHGEASRAHGRWRGAAERRHGGRPRHSGGGGASSRAAKVLGDGGCSLRGKTLGHRRYL